MEKTIEALIIEIRELNGLNKEYSSKLDKRDKKIGVLNRKIEVLEEKIIKLTKQNLEQRNKILSSQKENRRVEKHLKAIINRKGNENNKDIMDKDNILCTTILLLGEHYNFDGEVILQILKELKSVDIKLISRIIDKLVIVDKNL